MKKSQIIIGHQYEVQAGRNKTKVKVVSFNEEKQSWQCETPSGKNISIKDTARFLKEVTEKKSLKEIIESKGVKLIPKGRRATNSMRDLDDQCADAGPRSASPSDGPLHVVPLAESSISRGPKPNGEMSVLAAAHRVLQESGRPMNVRDIMNTALEKGYCVVGGKTPFNTFNGGIRKEISQKGEQSRFERVGPGLFAAR